MIKKTQINNVKVNPIKVANPETREVLGKDIQETCFSNTFLLAKKNSGKTTINTLFKMIKECAGCCKLLQPISDHEIIRIVT